MGVGEMVARIAELKPGTVIVHPTLVSMFFGSSPGLSSFCIKLVPIGQGLPSPLLV